MKKPTISCLSERIKIISHGRVIYKHAGKTHTGGQTKKHKRVFFKKTFRIVPKQFKRIMRVI